MNKKSELFKKADVFLIIGIVITAALIYILIQSNSVAGNTVTVTVNGIIYAELPLNKDTDLDIANKDGDITNRLEIKNGYAYMTESDCPYKYCVNQGKIKNAGESIVCLPNKVVVTVTGDGVDAVAN